MTSGSRSTRYDEVLPGTPDVQGAPAAPANAWLKWLPWVALIALAAGMVAWEAWRGVPIEVAGNPLANATFARLTDWEGTEEQADISPDGRFVTFVADKAGEFDVWVSQVGTGRFQNLTLDGPPMVTPANLLRSLGFNGDGSEIWFNPEGNPGREKVLLPLTGGTPRPFLRRGYSTPSWSPDNARLALIDSDAHGDPLYLADRIGANPHPINVPPQDTQPFFREGRHTHNPVWSPDGEWIYFVHGTGPTGRMDVWRMKPSGASPEQLTAPARRREFSGAARSAHAALCGPRGRLVRTVAVGPRRREQGDASSDRGARAIHVRVGEPGRPSRGRDRGETHGQPLARPVERSPRRGCRCAALPGANRTGAGTAPSWSVVVLPLALYPRDRRRALAVSQRPGVRSDEGRRQRAVRASRGVARWQPCRGRRQAARETTARHHVGRRHQLADPGSVHRDPWRRGARRG